MTHFSVKPQPNPHARSGPVRPTDEIINEIKKHIIDNKAVDFDIVKTNSFKTNQTNGLQCEFTSGITSKVTFRYLLRAKRLFFFYICNLWYDFRVGAYNEPIIKCPVCKTNFYACYAKIEGNSNNEAQQQFRNISVKVTINPPDADLDPYTLNIPNYDVMNNKQPSVSSKYYHDGNIFVVYGEYEHLKKQTKEEDKKNEQMHKKINKHEDGTSSFGTKIEFYCALILIIVSNFVLN